MEREGEKAPASLKKYLKVHKILLGTYLVDEIESRAEEELCRCVQAEGMSEM